MFHVLECEHVMFGPAALLSLTKIPPWHGYIEETESIQFDPAGGPWSARLKLSKIGVDGNGTV